MKTKHHGQMSESFLTAVFLSLSGGLQDAYTYLPILMKELSAQLILPLKRMRTEIITLRLHQIGR